MERSFDMVSMDREAAPLLAEKREHDKSIKALVFVRAFICAMVLAEVAGIVLAILKITKVINWPWMITLIPLWTMLAMILALFTLVSLSEALKNRK